MPHTSICRNLRERYYKIWSHHWPESDKFLHTLWVEARDPTKLPPRGKHAKPLYEATLELMRENHSFTPTQEPT